MGYLLVLLMTRPLSSGSSAAPLIILIMGASDEVTEHLGAQNDAITSLLDRAHFGAPT